MRYGRTFSQGDRILRVLADGKRHMPDELGVPLEVRAVRLRELRKRGYRVQFNGDGSYRLIGGLGENGVHGYGPFRDRSAA